MMTGMVWMIRIIMTMIMKKFHGVIMAGTTWQWFLQIIKIVVMMIVMMFSKLLWFLAALAALYLTLVSQ